ncbi:hypothetical protein BH11PLA2_BH11PLA2_23440 [soil metagenome]
MLIVCCGALFTGYRFWPRPRMVPHGPATFTCDVAPIIFAKCAPCHHPGEAAPFSLMNYEDVKKRASQIMDVTHTRFMPPWLPASGHGDFVNARRMSQEELLTLQEWVAAGTPRGNDADLPAVPVFAEGWQSGTPDLILESPAYTLNSQQGDVFRNFVVPIMLESPRWVQSIELRPDNPRVTHHARLGIDSSNESVRRDAEDPEPGYAGMAWSQDPDGQLVLWAPGMIAHAGAPGVAWRLYPKTAFVLHTHMQPSGKPEVMRFRIGIRFASEPPTVRPAILRIGSSDIDIPAGARHHVVKDEYMLPIDVDVQTVFPHAHSLCQSLTVEAERPDGTRVPLIFIEHFDENWHETYRYRQPLRLPKSTKLHSTFTYDNSAENIRNRNRPPQRVVHGSNANDEMADVYLQVTPVQADQRTVLMEHYKRYDLQSQIVGYRKSLEHTPDNPWSQEGLAACYFATGEPAKAIVILEQRIKTEPKAIFPRVSLGMAQLASGDAPRAEATLRQAIAMDGEYALAWYGLGKALAVQKQTQLAEHAYRKAVELAPSALDCRLNLADLLMQQGKWDQAAAVCNTALSDSPDMASMYLKLAEISARQQKYDESLLHCKMAQRLAPYTHPPKVLLASFANANGDLARAVKLLQDARVESPEHPMPLLILGQLARRQQQTAVAREFFAAAMEKPIPHNWPESHRQRYQVLLHSERYELAEQLRDNALARDALTEWLKCEPDNPRVKTLLAERP